MRGLLTKALGIGGPAPSQGIGSCAGCLTGANQASSICARALRPISGHCRMMPRSPRGSFVRKESQHAALEMPTVSGKCALIRPGDNRFKFWASLLAGLALAAAPSLAPAQVSLLTIVNLAQRNSSSVQLAEANVEKAGAQLEESHDVFIPSLSFGSGLPAFPEIGFTGALPTLYDATIQSMAFSMPMIRQMQAARAGLAAAELSLEDAREQVALDASTAFIELDTVNRELKAAHQQEADARRLVAIERQRTEAGVDPLLTLLHAQLTAAQLKLNRQHLEARASALAKQIAGLTGLSPESITPDHASIPAIPAIAANAPPRPTPGLDSARMLAKSKAVTARGDQERRWMPEFSFGVIYNRNTTVLNDINSYYGRSLPANNFSSGINIDLPIFNPAYRARARASAADALRAKIEAEQAQDQNNALIAALTAQLRELATQAEIANLNEEIAGQELKSVQSQLQVGSGSGSPGAKSQPQMSPTNEQRALINQQQKYEEALDAQLKLDEARLNLLRALGHLQDWLSELHGK